MPDRFAVAGLGWWGVGPVEMAQAMTRNGDTCDSVILWNIRRRLDRLLMSSPFSGIEGLRRLNASCLSRHESYRAIFVVSPHRFSLRMLRSLKSRCAELVALIGDAPLGARRVETTNWSIFDRVLSADESWLRLIPDGCSVKGIMPWGSTLIDPALLSSDTYEPSSVVMVGSPYPERIELAKQLVGRSKLILQGTGWPNIPGVILRPSASRLATLEQIRANRELVVNVHHDQFDRGLNPQFYDFAAAGIPQVVVHADDIFTYRLGLDSLSQDRSFLDQDLLLDERIQSVNSELVAKVRNSYMFHSCIKRGLK